MKDTILVNGCDAFNAQGKEQDAWRDAAPESKQIRREVLAQVRRVFQFLEFEEDSRRFQETEKGLIGSLFTLGRLFLAYYLAWREEHSRRDVNHFRRQGFCGGPRQSRKIGTYFGPVRYWRTYLRRSGSKSGGIYPLDLALGLTGDGFSMLVMSLAARLSTHLPFDHVTGFLVAFLSWSPSKTTVEKAVLGFGQYTEEWFEQAPPPEGDGPVLVIQIDSKAAPTAREEELRRRRGRRRNTQLPKSPRHRGRAQRRRRGPRPRRKKGDKSKNGRAVTVVVMYTLRPHRTGNGKQMLLGPINRKVYASFGRKRLAFAAARREANKRGFTAASGRRIQIVTDGELAFETCVGEFFPEALHTVDIYHVFEYLWKAGECLYKEGSEELAEWVERQKKRLYAGEANKVVSQLKRRLRGFPKTGPGNKGKRKRLAQAIGYLGRRVDLMCYDDLIEEDLEIASGSVEGAIKHIVAKRFDNGGMRWIPERAQALLQLRCIEFNGDWEAFVSFVHDKIMARARSELTATRLLTKHATPIPGEERAA